MSTGSNPAEEQSGGKTRWPRYFFYSLGALFAILYLGFTLASIYYTPKKYPVFTTFAGFFNSNESVITVLFITLVVVYTAFFFLVRATTVSKKIFVIGIAFAVLFSALLILSPPFMSVDLYGYIFRAEIVNTHNVNPYVVTPADLGYESEVPWAQTNMKYGPLYTVISMGLQRVSGSELSAELTVFRLFNILLFFGSAFFIFKAVRSIIPRFSRAATLLFLWNPFLLIELVHNGHNDVMILFCIVLSFYALVQKKYFLAIIVLVFGFLIKFLTIFLIPIVLLMLMRDKKPTKWKLKQLLLICVVSIVPIALFYLPFQNFNDNVGNLGRAYFANYKLTFVKAIMNGATNITTDVLNINPVSVDGLMNIHLIVFVIGYLIILFYPKKQGQIYDGKRFFWILLLALSIIANMNNIWYSVVLFPLVLFTTDKYYYPIILMLTLSGFIFYIESNLGANTLLMVMLLVYLFILRLISSKKYSFGIISFGKEL